MIGDLLRRLQIMLLSAALAACGFGGTDFGTTIGDLEDMPPLLETVELEPQASFEVDRQQVIESFRDLVAITAEGRRHRR